MNITDKQISNLIADYIAKGYGEKVMKREWKGRYIRGHAPWNNTKDCYHEWLRIINDCMANLSNYTSFAELLNAVEGLKIEGIGDLTIYDTATMIGCPIGVYPEVVYLHAGTAVGAHTLGIKGTTATKEQFVKVCGVFEKLEPIQIEDFLCIYKYCLQGNAIQCAKVRARMKNNKACGAQPKSKCGC